MTQPCIYFLQTEEGEYVLLFQTPSDDFVIRAKDPAFFHVLEALSGLTVDPAASRLSPELLL